MNYNDEILKQSFATDGRKTLPHHPIKKWGQRDPSKLIGVVFHQSLAEHGTAKATAAYHVGPNHIDATGLPGLSYTGFVEESGKFFLANNVEDKTLSQGEADISGDENALYLAVCFGGNFSGPGYKGTQNTTAVQLDTAGKFWALAKRLWGFKNNQLFGHCDFGKPACPGNDLVKLIESVRANRDWVGADFRLHTTTGRQDALKKLGFYKGDITGGWDQPSKVALVAFQRANNLSADGVWGNKTEAAVTSLLSQKS